MDTFFELGYTKCNLVIQKEIVSILSGAIHFGRSCWLAEERENAVPQEAPQTSPGPSEPLGLRLQYGTVVLAQENGII